MDNKIQSELLNDAKELIELLYSIYQEKTTNFDDIQNIVLNKIFSNLGVVISLISINRCNEAKIIQRSALESMAFYMYYAVNKSKAEEIINDVNMVRFKNAFISYNLIRKSDKKLIEAEAKLRGITNEEWIKSSEDYVYYVFNDFLVESNKSKILNELKTDKFELNLKNIKSLEKIFNKFSPVALSFELMMKKIPDINSGGVTINTRNSVFNEYNHYSQVTHGLLGDWMTFDNNYLNILRNIQDVIVNVIINSGKVFADRKEEIDIYIQKINKNEDKLIKKIGKNFKS